MLKDGYGFWCVCGGDRREEKIKKIKHREKEDWRDRGIEITELILCIPQKTIKFFGVRCCGIYRGPK